ncbi:hypothetical protein DSECCO2_640650 [anaerobic digester metagenome]
MRGTGHGPGDGCGDVFRAQGGCPFVQPGGAIGITAKAHHGKLAFRKPRLDVGHPDARAVQVCPQAARKLHHERLGATIHVGTGVGIGAGDGPQIDDMPAPPLHHAGQQGAGDVQQALDVGVHHGRPVVQAASVSGFQPQGQARIVHQHVHGAPCFGQVFKRVLYGGRIAHVEAQRQTLVRPQFRNQRVQTVLAAPGGDDAPAIGGKAAGGGCTETGGRPGDAGDAPAGGGLGGSGGGSGDHDGVLC